MAVLMLVGSPPPPAAILLRDHDLPDLLTIGQRAYPDFLTVALPADTAPSGWEFLSPSGGPLPGSRPALGSVEVGQQEAQ